MMTIGHLADIENLHRLAVAQNAAALEWAENAGDERTLRDVREGTAFLDIVAGWIAESAMTSAARGGTG